MRDQGAYSAMLAHYVVNCFLAQRFAYDLSGDNLDSNRFLTTVEGTQATFVQGLAGVLNDNAQYYPDEYVSRDDLQEVHDLASSQPWRSNLGLVRRVYEVCRGKLRLHDLDDNIIHAYSEDDPEFIKKMPIFDE